MEEANYYTILGVPPDAHFEDIKSAYKKMLKKYHPDVFIGDKKRAEDLCKKINDAYSVIGDEILRKEYDREIFGPFGYNKSKSNFNEERGKKTDFEDANNNCEVDDSNSVVKSDYIVNPHSSSKPGLILVGIAIILFIFLSKTSSTQKAEYTTTVVQEAAPSSRQRRDEKDLRKENEDSNRSDASTEAPEASQQRLKTGKRANETERRAHEAAMEYANRYTKIQQEQNKRYEEELRQNRKKSFGWMNPNRSDW